MGRTATKLFIVGLDGGTFRFIKPLVEAGRMPNFGRLLREGVWGELESTIPPATPPAWSSFMTGKNPGKHGVFNFYVQPQGSYESELVSGAFVRTRKFWEDLQEQGRFVVLMDIPLTFPPPSRMNGVMISGMPVPSEEAVFTYPPELHTEIIREFGDYPLEHRVLRWFRGGGNPVESLRLLYDHQRRRKEVASYLVRKQPWDLFMVVFRGTDLVQHPGFRFYDEDFRRRNPEQCLKYSRIIEQFYEKIDSYLGELFALLPSDCTVMAMSDHGAGPVAKVFYINAWLREQGYLRIKTADPVRRARWKVTRNTLAARFSKAGLGAWVRLIPGPLKKVPVFLLTREQKRPAERVDWRRTRAYSSWTLDERIVRLNLEDREPQGIVPAGDYERLREEIAGKLSQVRDPQTKEPIIERVYRREELCEGPFTERAGDLVVMTRENSYMFRGDLRPPALFYDPETRGPAVHRMQGIFALRGADVRLGQELKGLRIIDLAPTILYLFGLPVPEDMDGRVIAEAFSDRFVAEHPVLHRPAAGGETPQAKIRYSDEEQQRIEDILKGLGYLG
jgi:predicted AlkP superfamily phosphohydrolase/phosphomutase